MRKRYIVLLLFILILPITKIEGYYCSFAESSRLKQIAANVNYSYDYEIVNNKVKFNITLVNLNPDIYFVDSNNKTYRYKSNEINLKGYDSGKVKFKFYAVDEDCEDVLREITITLPHYNKFYNDAVCEGVKNYSLCQKWTENNYDYDTFVKKVNLYKESLKEEPVEDVIEEENNEYFLDIILDFILEYYYIFLVAIIIFSGIGIYVIDKKSNIYK